jgi:hypothetical protein
MRSQIIERMVPKSSNKTLSFKRMERRRKETTRGWEILVQWKDGSTTWIALKDMKNSYPVQLAEYATQRRIAGEPAFAWWIHHVLNNRNRIISKLKAKYWVRTHSLG